MMSSLGDTALTPRRGLCPQTYEYIVKGF